MYNIDKIIEIPTIIFIKISLYGLIIALNLVFAFETTNKKYPQDIKQEKTEVRCIVCLKNSLSKSEEWLTIVIIVNKAIRITKINIFCNKDFVSKIPPFFLKHNKYLNTCQLN